MKKTQLNLSSTNEDMLYTMEQEGKSVEYWHKKHYGGPRKYDQWQDEQLKKVQELPADSEILGEMVDYHSLATGNRWKSFEVTSGYGVGNAYTRMIRFCYWDTYGSIGAFFNCKSDAGKRALLVFPSHFFLRYADRMGIKHRDAALVCEFFNRNHAFAINLSEEPDENGRRQFVIASKEGACYGFARTQIESKDDFYNRDNVFEVRTFIKYEQLSPRKLKECQVVREASEMGRMTDGAPIIHFVGRAMTDKKFYDRATSLLAKSYVLTAKQMDICQKINDGVVKAADFVSGDYRSILTSLEKGTIDEAATQTFAQLMGIIAKRVRETDNYANYFGFHELLDITHEWKGDAYDWNKWFWHLNYNMKANYKGDNKDWFDYQMEKCIAESYSYQQIEEITKQIDNINQRNHDRQRT